MNELTIEQKARAYDEAKARMSKAYNSNRCTIGFMNEIFPELKESEDEKKTQESLMQYLWDMYHKEFYPPRPTMDVCDKWLAWLEKQGNANKEYWRGYREGKQEILDKYAELEKQGDTNGTINRDEFAQGVLRGVAIDLINWIDCNAAEGNMCLSNMECEDIEDALVNGDWDKIYAYIKKKLEKQGKNNKHSYIRFGDIPKDEKSKVYNGEIEIGTENGVSVYPAFEDSDGNIVLGLSLPITKTSLHTQQYLLEYDNRACYLVSGDCVGKGTDGEPLLRNVKIIQEIKNFRVKQDEQKPQGKSALETIKEEKVDGTNKVEPKFKIEKDKWYVCTQTFILRDKKVIIKGQTYQAEKDNVIKGEDGCCFIDRHDGKASDYLRSWTSAEAKDGDVLAVTMYPEGTWIGIFKEQNGCTFSSYCFVNTEGIFKKGTYNHGNGRAIHPATKEQRKQLEKAMAEAGYTFDFKRKELKKIEQKPIDKDGVLNILNKENQQIQQEDLIMKPSLNTEQNPAWSGEDEEIINKISAAIATHYSCDTAVKVENWLKSLRPQKQWKPSNEQMKALSTINVTGDISYAGQGQELIDLYKNLKKLRGE